MKKGEAIWLTREGLRQAAQLRERLKTIKWDGVISSSSPRAVRTAELISGINPEHSGTGLSAMKDILSTFKGGNVLVVSHRITLKVIMNYYSGNTLSDIARIPDIKPASLNKMVLKDDKSVIELYGDTTHYAIDVDTTHPKEEE
ncbi:histidine phosphatase family protein [Paenibacillus filicis]|uniref:Histidine phosphatase family protein n=1 Tax=Paenibacillus gyeongsangnamensis TaxID=3388067 RepID=A0ABT4Q4D2_9BACL|nr:histidine phosphatase family protein [Paenibacillus filicis]MCZ8511696.1 histidine phosphatase family protein [Paenibacillus filicis]